MSALDALAAIGEIGLGYERTRTNFDKAAREAALEELRIEEGRRRAAEQAYEAETRALIRSAAAKYGLGGANQIPATPERVIPAVPYNQAGTEVGIDDSQAPVPPLVPEKRIPGSPAQADDRGMLAEQERIARARLADPRLEESLTKARKNIEAEGYSEFLTGIVAGQDPEAIKRKFNAKGAQKIASMEKDAAGVYTVTYEDGATQQIDRRMANALGTKLGIFKKDQGFNVPWGAKHVTEDGTVIDNSRIDPNSQPVIDAKNAAAIELANYKARFLSRVTGAGKEPAAVAAAKWLADNVTDGDIGKAAEIAFHIKNSGGDREKRLRLWAAEIRKDPRYMASKIEDVQKKAEEIMGAFDDEKPSATPKPSTPAPSAPAATPTAPAEPEQLGDPKLRQDSKPQGFKIDTPPAEQKSIIGPNGKTYAWKDVVATARKRGMTTQEVISQVRKASEATP